MRQGLLAKLFYLNDSQPRFGSVNPYIEQGQPLQDFTLYFSRLNIPTRPWDRGFVTTTGNVITNQQGTTLYEWFGLEFQTDLRLSGNEPAGYYQLAVLSDDGATVHRRNADDSLGTLIIDNDGSHPTRLGCASTPILLDGISNFPITLRYYQGPRFHIALVLMKRPWLSPNFNPQDVECGQMGNDRFFDSTQNPPVATANYHGLEARGFASLTSENYGLPVGFLNACNLPAPILSLVQVIDVLSDSAKVSWTTDVASTSQVEVTNVGTGEVVQVPMDLRLMNDHTVNVSGLLPNTLYRLVAISMSDSGKTTRSDVLTIRTRR